MLSGYFEGSDEKSRGRAWGQVVGEGARQSGGKAARGFGGEKNCSWRTGEGAQKETREGEQWGIKRMKHLSRVGTKRGGRRETLYYVSKINEKVPQVLRSMAGNTIGEILI